VGDVGEGKTSKTTTVGLLASMKAEHLAEHIALLDSVRQMPPEELTAEFQATCEATMGTVLDFVGQSIEDVQMFFAWLAQVRRQLGYPEWSGRC
jgi:hypothetical protein